MIEIHRDACLVVGVGSIDPRPPDRAVLAVVGDAPGAGLGGYERLVAVEVVLEELRGLGDVDAARHGRYFVRAVGWRGERGGGATYWRAQPPAARTRRRGGNGERRYVAYAHGIARSHCRVLYHIRRDEITVRTKCNPTRKMQRRPFTSASSRQAYTVKHMLQEFLLSVE